MGRSGTLVAMSELSLEQLNRVEVFLTNKHLGRGHESLAYVIIKMDYCYRHLTPIVTDAFYDECCKQFLKGPTKGHYSDMISEGVSSGFLGIREEDYPAGIVHRAKMTLQIANYKGFTKRGKLTKKAERTLL